MNYFALDTSGFAKRYHLEIGSASVNALVLNLLNNRPKRLIISSLIVAEVVSVLNRAQNRGQMQQRQLDDALNLLDRESQAMTSLLINDLLIDSSHALILRHNINSADAILLRQTIDFAQTVALAGHQPWLVASDSRLLRAAASEGLATLNPETFEPSQVASLI